MNRRDGSFSAAAIAVSVLGALAAHVVLGVAVGEGYAIPTTIVGAIAAAVVLRGPVGHALARRIQGPAPSELPPDQLLGELDELRTRLAELEERADFSERLLAQQRERSSTE
ncbi:MAG: hypothetical protein FJ206_14950 [Gemmatimonadetes bacterium]|nr:hypothetical protein [Gemmatimonadota bacterium]